MASKKTKDLWPFLHADLMAERPKARAALLQKLKRFFCFDCGRDIQNDYCRCPAPDLFAEVEAPGPK